jgi:hypothetical protein
MQCENCGYIFFRPSKKCTCCGAPFVAAQSSFDVGQENLFTIFEMAPGDGGIPSSVGMGEASAGVEDYNFTDDFDTGEAEYGVDENVLDLSDAEAAGYGVSADTGSMGVDEFEFDSSGTGDLPPSGDAGLDDFNLDIPGDTAELETLSLDIPDDTAELETLSTETPEPDAEADDSMNMDFGGEFDEVEGLGFGFDESPASDSPETATEEISLDADLEPEISLEPELELPEEEPSLELSEEPELDMADEQPSLEIPEDSLELSEDLSVDPDDFNAVEENPSIELSDDLDLAEEPELMETPMDEFADLEDEGAIEFDLDNVDLDEPEEEVTFVGGEVEPLEEEETGGEEPFMDLEGLEMEIPEEPEDEDLKP